MRRLICEIEIDPVGGVTVTCKTCDALPGTPPASAPDGAAQQQRLDLPLDGPSRPLGQPEPRAVRSLSGESISAPAVAGPTPVDRAVAAAVEAVATRAPLVEASGLRSANRVPNRAMPPRKLPARR
jgi:hypothetical protein